MQKKFIVNDSKADEAVSQALEFIHAQLKAQRLGEKEFHRAELMCEESLKRMLKYSDFTETNAFKVTVINFLVNVNIDIAMPGSSFDFTGFRFFKREVSGSCK